MAPGIGPLVFEDDEDDMCSLNGGMFVLANRMFCCLKVGRDYRFGLLL